MKIKDKYSVLLLPLVFLVAVALLAPQISSSWYDRQTLGQLSYENMDYEPYEISPYHSFADKMKAIADGLYGGSSLYRVKLKERVGAPDNQELVEIVNEELKALYGKGIIPQEWSIQELGERNFYQMYVIPEDNEEIPFQDLCYWYITAETEEGSVMLTMDSSYYKVFAVRMFYDEERMTAATNMWLEEQAHDSYFSLTAAWCSYWELEDIEIISAYKDKTYGNVATDGLYGMEEEYGILFLEGQEFRELNRLENYNEYGMIQWITGMQELSP